MEYFNTGLNDDIALTVLSFGAGQDSTYILYKIIRDPEYKTLVVKGRLIVAMSDTGDEHDYTYEHVEFIKKLCNDNDIWFFFITPDMGFHPRTWPTMISQLRLNNSIMSMMLPRSCTDNVKIKPFYNFLNNYIANVVYDQDLKSSQTRDKVWIKRFNSDHGKIRVILGIASGEEKRVKTTKKELKALQLDAFVKTKIKRKSPVWMDVCIEKIYPMILDGIDRQRAQDYILVTPWPLPPPSNCKRCPFMSKQEMLWMYRFIPGDYYEWVELEQNKINKNPERERNLGVKGEKLLPEILSEAIAEFGHWSNGELQEYKMSHGHCVNSKY